MFSLTRIIGVVPVGSLQPTQLQIVGAFACSGGGTPVELRILSPSGGPTTTFAETTSNGAPGTPPVESVTFLVPGWAAAVCGAKFEFEVRGFCGGQWSTWQRVSGVIDCLGCPRVALQTTYGACNGTMQTVTVTATIMLPPNTTTSFTWDHGDGSRTPGGPLTNNTSNWNTPLTLATTHDFDATGGPYEVCLEPPATSECPRVCVTVTPDCGTVACPAVSGAATVGACAADGSRPVTYTLTLTPPAPANSSVQVSWGYGGPNAGGQTSASQVVSTSAGPVGSITHQTNLKHRSGGYATTATVVILVNGQLCPIASSTVTIQVAPAPCLPCPDPARPVTVTITAPSGSGWCAPVQGLSASMAAQVNWVQPAPSNPPSPVRYDWSVTLPDGRVATQSTTGTTVSTSTGWSGPGAANGGIDLSAAGSYAVGVVAVFSPTAGLPTDSTGAVSCQLVGSGAIVLAACPSTTPCPSFTGLTTTAGCADPATGQVASITATATISDPGGIVQDFVWDFGDPGSVGNQTTTAVPTASHDYAQPGNYTVTCRVQTRQACAGGTPIPTSVQLTVPRCGSPPPKTPPTRIGCDALLWIALVLIAISGVLAVIGCIIAKSAPQAAMVLGIIAAALLVIGLVLFLIWWAICRFFTACSVIIAAMHFMGILISVFFVVGVILAFIASLGGQPDMWLCMGVSFVQSGIWGVLLYILYRIAVAVGCITENAGGPPPPKGPSAPSSSGALSSDPTRRETGPDRMAASAGLGDLVMSVTDAMGIRPCAACHERAARLNRLVPFGRPEGQAG